MNNNNFFILNNLWASLKLKISFDLTLYELRSFPSPALLAESGTPFGEEKVSF
jgi:hypothetical protein